MINAAFMQSNKVPRRFLVLRRVSLLFAFALAAFSPAAPSVPAHRLALWGLVHYICVPLNRLTRTSGPCVAVDPGAGYAVVPDITAPYHLVLVPIRRLTGIEDPQLLGADTSNYWPFAWAERRLLAARLHTDLPRDKVAMAVNAFRGRSQDQLHIHISCVRKEVAHDLLAAAPTMSESWSTIKIADQPWRARLVDSEDLNNSDPFKLLTEDDDASGGDRGRFTLVVVGALLPDGRPGFYLLNRATNPAKGSDGHGEFLLDERCTSVRRSAT